MQSLGVLGRRAVLLIGALWFSAGAGADALLRQQEIAQCLPGEVQTWGDGQDRVALANPLVFLYNHQDAPSWLSQDAVLGALTAAQRAWAQCGIGGTVLAVETGTKAPLGASAVGWSERYGPGYFGLANMGDASLTLGPKAFEMLKARNPQLDPLPILQMVVSHEMGHLYGLVAHSRRCVDVTSYYSNAKGETCSVRGGKAPSGVPEYRASLPTACDIQRCRMANRMPQLK
ncbi:hypothetical protein [Rhodoferax aquaticus]|uniref:Matrixin family metalloprotease n=1 Tax=Rhodoferax aquaticus TaxID=2527691 RepID=A0A515EPC7_9BURK|nr:hypothetical protein [Rhodoferax aquaticus]QDL54475.1 hypothetical protein EXZ61_10040 [Rhodoferax aquaticus]